MSSAAEPSDEARTVHQLFEARARRAPEASAVECGELRLTYGELDARADRLARHLAELGLRPGALAAVALRRGPELVVAVLAVLKAGAAYVPLEPSAPDHTIRHILSDALPSMVLTQEVNRVRLSDATGRRVLCLDTLAGAWLLAAWWPQDNFYRLSRAADWPRQTALAYGFNVTLIVAAVVVVRFLSWQPPAPLSRPSLPAAARHSAEPGHDRAGR